MPVGTIIVLAFLAFVAVTIFKGYVLFLKAINGLIAFRKISFYA